MFKKIQTRQDRENRIQQAIYTSSFENTDWSKVNDRKEDFTETFVDSEGQKEADKILKSSFDFSKDLFHKALKASKSSPNLSDSSVEKERQRVSPAIFKNLSVSCVNSPPFLNPHKALNDIYKKFSNNGSSFQRSFSLRDRNMKKLEDIYKYCNKENTFIVKLKKSSKGLGICIYGGRDVSRKDPFHQLIRVGNLHPSQPALESGKVTLGDVILEVNGISMLGLSNAEARETLRNAPTDVELKIFRPSKFLLPSVPEFKERICSDSGCSTGCASNVNLRVKNVFNTLSGEFTITLMKQAGCLGFSIVRFDNSKELIGAFFIKALTREPAISDGRIRAFDRIIKVNGKHISTFTHSEALGCLRNAPEMVTLTLCRSCNIKTYCPRHSLPKVYTFNVVLAKMSNEKFGLTIWDANDNDPDAQRYPLLISAKVKEVDSDSLAQRNGIKEGDRIVEVNGESCLYKKADEVIDMILKTNGITRMVLWRR